MEIRTLNADEFEQSIKLSEYAFQYTMTPEAKQKAKERFKPERVWGAFDDEGHLNAKLVLIPLAVYIQGKSFLMGGIGGVSTWPEKRRQGSVTRLLTHTLEKMNEAGHVLSVLHPFSYSFYRKYGWEMFSDYKKYVIPTEKLPKKQDTEGSVRRDVTDIATLNDIYNCFARDYNGLLVREESWWRNSVLDEHGHTAVYYSASGDAEGYVIYKIENNEFLIDEFICLTETAKLALWTYISNHDSMVKQVVLSFIPPDDMLPYRLADPRINQEIIPYGMARIVNVKSLVEEYPFQGTGSEEQLTIQVTDPYAPWNEGGWTWTFSKEGKAAVLRADFSEASESVLICDIQSLTAMLTGYMRPSELLNMGRITGNPHTVSKLEVLIPNQRTLFLDFF